LAVSDSFGFFEYSKPIIFNGGKVSVSEDYGLASEWINKYKNRDGYFYPPTKHRVKFDPITKEEEEIPNTKRPALLYRLPSSHKIALKNDDARRDSDLGLIIHLASYIFGTRVQFHDWWFDGRVPIKPANDFSLAHSTIEDFISCGYETWKSWNLKNRKNFINILFMHSRAPLYEWDWERFINEYIVFDAIFDLAKKLYGCKASTHKYRFKSLCEEFGIMFNSGLVDLIYISRNSLFHHSLWDNGQPCSASDSHEVFMLPFNLHKFNARVIPALLGYNSPFIETSWWSLGQCCFDMPTSSS